MAKSKAKPASKKSGKLAGKTIAFVGKFGYGNHELEECKAIATKEGAAVVEAEKAVPDCLVAGDGVAGNPPAVVAKIQKKHPQVQVLDLADFYKLLAPTPEEVLHLLRSGKHEDEFWDKLYQKIGGRVDLAGTDFRSVKISNANLEVVNLDNCDFRQAKLTEVFLGELKGAKFDGATLVGGYLSQAEDCSFKNVMMKDPNWFPGEFVRCDFSGAVLAIESGSNAIASGCIFKKAKLCSSELDDSHFDSADFSGADLSEAKLRKCDFTNANLSGTDLSRADLRDAHFVNANLKNANFQNAVLTGANLTGANVDGADFTGANLTNVTLGNIDTSKAKDLQQKAARTPGPKLRELTKIAQGSKSFKTSIEVELGKKEFVVLEITLSNSWAHGMYTHHKPNGDNFNRVDAPSFEQGLLNLTDLWSRGKPRFNTVKVVVKKSPMKGEELNNLATAAWHEAFGLEVPSTEVLQKHRETWLSDSASLRDKMLAELKGGAKGVKKFNARSSQDRDALGKLRKQDFSNLALVNVFLHRLELGGSCFDGSDLREAEMSGSDLKEASFVKAKLNNANLMQAKCAEATFEEASLKKSDLRTANLRLCNFKNADLTKADISGADIGGADFSGATLDGVEFYRTKFDEKTTFPSGFTYPEGLEWKGTGPRPGTQPPPPPPKTGSIDFETFLQQLNNKVELARMQKAGSMLKAERFQLFAEVKDDSLVGVVKSQTSKDLVYSCRLASDGAFSCCTQNLKPCGGLRGALCKHLLVLIVGLAKAEHFDAATVDHWINLSRSQKPAIDEDVMSATFLRYKGAEAGEVDWRPTETIPEDFYAM